MKNDIELIAIPICCEKNVCDFEKCSKFLIFNYDKIKKCVVYISFMSLEEKYDPKKELVRRNIRRIITSNMNVKNLNYFKEKKVEVMLSTPEENALITALKYADGKLLKVQGQIEH
ncbi:hypothetical protein ACFL7D_04990 [candidate division KSB1 bacterium]